MSTTRTFTDAEGAVHEWALAQPGIVSAARTNTSGRPNIYLGLPNGSPMPAVSIYRSGGAPRPFTDVPVDEPRITFDCWGANRADAKALAAAVVSAAESLNDSAAFMTAAGDRLHSAEVLLWLFRPDQTSQKPVPRYVVDIRFAIIAAQ